MKLGNKLANSDNSTRLEALKEATKQFASSQNKLDLLKLWKGIFYSYWMADTRPTQQQYATQISEMIVNSHELTKILETFYETINREWYNLDRLRLKY